MSREREPSLTPLVDSSDEPADVRALLAAGATDDLGYDFDKGLSAHLGAIGALPVAGPAGPGAVSNTAATKAAAAVSSKALLLLVGVPGAAASIALAVWLGAGSHREVTKVAAVPPVPGMIATAAADRAPDPVAPMAVGAAAGAEAPADRSASPAGRSPHVALAAHGGAGSVAPERITLQEQSGETAGAGALDAPARGSAAASAASAAADQADEEATRRAVAEREARAEAAGRQAGERFQREMSGLVDAKHALQSDPARALTLAQQGEHDFPHGVFAEERQHILILALIRLGRLSEARRTAAPYLEQHPDSPFARKVRTALDAAAHPTR